MKRHGIGGVAIAAMLLGVAACKGPSDDRETGDSDTGAPITETGESDSGDPISETGDTDTEPAEPSIAIAAPVDDFETDEGQELTFQVLAEDLEEGVEYAWEFGDGDSETTSNPSGTHTYASPGIYSVSLSATQPDGSAIPCRAEGECEITVVANTTPCLSAENEDCKRHITVNSGMKMEYWRNYALGTPNEAIRRVVIIQHGAGRDAESYFGSAIKAAKAEGRVHSSLIMALHFQISGDNPDDNELYWTNKGWAWGYLSENEPETSSYAIMDEVFKKIAEPGKFPNLEELILFGHSAGGQYVNRFVAGSDAADDPNLSGIPILFVVANPSSVVYLNEYRARPGETDVFEVPGRDPNLECLNTYNDYGYGLGDLNEYIGTSTKSRIRKRYESRTVVYMAGTEDNDSTHSSLDRSCQALLQGANRLERAEIYFNFLEAFYDTSNHSFLYAQGVGHTGYGMLNSKEGKALIW
jgi:hypothetical protein